MHAITAECESLCDSLMLNCHIHLRQLLVVELVEGQLDRADGVEQIAVALQSVSRGDGRSLCTDELPLLQPAHILAGSVGAYPHCSADSLVAGPALVGISILSAEQIEVDRQSTGRQPQQKYLVGQLEVVLDRITLEPLCVLQSAPP